MRFSVYHALSFLALQLLFSQCNSGALSAMSRVILLAARSCILLVLNSFSCYSPVLWFMLCCSFQYQYFNRLLTARQHLFAIIANFRSLLFRQTAVTLIARYNAWLFPFPQTLALLA
jgi:hypothetical protein